MSGREQAHRDRSERVGLDEAHPLRIGTPITVLSLSANGQPFIEGRAVIQLRASGRHRYWVAFTGDPVLRERLVLPDQQFEPVCIQLVLPFREVVSRDDTLNVTDFFPDDFPA